MAQTPNPEQTKAMLAAVWKKNRDLLLHRMDSIESFCRQLPGAAKVQPLRDEASADAHKLAGSLGMFGLAQGTAVAREIENHLRENNGEELLAANLPSLAASLRELIETFHVGEDRSQSERNRP